MAATPLQREASDTRAARSRAPGEQDSHHRDPAPVVVTLDGRLADGTDPLIAPNDLGLLRGDGVFETTLVVRGRPRDLPEHLTRLQASARTLDIAIPQDEVWERATDQAIAAWTARTEADMVLRMIATRGTETGITTAGQTRSPATCFVMGSAVAERSRQQRTGVRVLTLPGGRPAAEAAQLPWLLSSAKTLSYAVSMAAIRHAQHSGADDVIFVDNHGAVIDGATAAVVIARGRTLRTPPVTGILPGITGARLLRAADAAGWEVAQEPVTVDDLHHADGVFLLSSVRLLAPVTAINGTPRSVPQQTARELGQLIDLP